MRIFYVDWKTTLLAAMLLPVMVSLGFWQLSRAEEKRQIQQRAEARQSLPPQLLESLLHTVPEAMQYQRVILKGKWQEPVFLLDNQVQKGRPGYHVLGVLELAGGERILVNRGWIPMMADRAVLPDAPSVMAGEEIGEVYVAPDFLLDKPVFAEAGWPKRIQKLHLPAISGELQSRLEPFVIRLLPGSPSALTPEWPVINMLPEKHVAYAIQWFAMAFALVVFYILLGLRGHGPGDAQTKQES